MVSSYRTNPTNQVVNMADPTIKKYMASELKKCQELLVDFKTTLVTSKPERAKLTLTLILSFTSGDMLFPITVGVLGGILQRFRWDVNPDGSQLESVFGVCLACNTGSILRVRTYSFRM